MPLFIGDDVTTTNNWLKQLAWTWNVCLSQRRPDVSPIDITECDLNAHSERYDMRILFPKIINSYGPVSTIHRKIAKNLSHDFVTFVNGSLDNDFTLDNIDIIEVSEKTLDRLYKYELAYFSEIDIIHTRTAGTFHVYNSLFQHVINGTSIVTTVHNVEEMSKPTNYTLHLQRYLMSRFSDSVTAISPYVAERFSKQYGREPAVIPNGVDTQKFKPNLHETITDRFLFVGRLVDRKHPELVLSLAQELNHCEFYIRPLDVPSYDELSLKLPENVHYLPELSVTELAKYYASSTATLCPFEREGFGMVILESLASGTPVIGLNHGNIPNLILDGDNGILCDDVDVIEWKSAINNIRQNQTGLDTRTSVMKYNWSAVAAEYEKFYQSVI